MALVPVIGKQELGLGPFATGILMAMEGAGAFCAALVIAWRVQATQYLRLYFWGSCLCVASALVFSQRSEEHTSELQSLMRISYAVFCLKKTIHLLLNSQHAHTFRL